VVALSIVILVLSSRRSTLIRRYPEVRNAARSPSDFILSSATYALFFFGYESMYRGFLLFGLERTVGLWPAVLVSAGFSGVMHVKTPPAVIVGSLAAGFLFAHMVIIVGSIWPVFVLHTCIGIGMDALCVRTLIRKYT
jgi:membrane protease YdiL (CAAX protease family)